MQAELGFPLLFLFVADDSIPARNHCQRLIVAVGIQQIFQWFGIVFALGIAFHNCVDFGKYPVFRFFMSLFVVKETVLDFMTELEDKGLLLCQLFQLRQINRNPGFRRIVAGAGMRIFIDRQFVQIALFRCGIEAFGQYG